MKLTMINHIKNLCASLDASHAAAGSVARRLAQQTTLQRGQNLQMMDFAELGRPSLRAHLAHPWVARLAPDNRTVVRVLAVGYWLGTTVAYALAILVGVVGAAVASHFTPG